MKKGAVNKEAVVKQITELEKKGTANAAIIAEVASSFKITKANASYYFYRVHKPVKKEKVKGVRKVSASVAAANSLTGFAPNVEKDWYRTVYGAGNH